ncbi:methylmalonyl-CoA epimerase [Stackebrandtia albiflava]|uniref:Methylmalonyl-CoA epimerase n=1 Tax=Stackebrandtia albiflava TaxID=406432 RepID=A0A562URT3_9ACTN|nr:methylmalonyl-CoA epimerase [Stackebrandtia albiflava]TWJ08324.1 methylmalonyl-CoA epimerase [Stackebrandtia albiflava]
MSEVLPVGLSAVDHVGVAVPDLAAAVRFYEDVLGGRCAHVEENEEQGVTEAMITFGSGAQVQLLAPSRPDSTIAKFIDSRGPGLQQLAFTVDDVEAASESLRAKGLRLLYDAPKRGTAGSRINFVHPKDAGGVLIELVEKA